jgi:hypothetical protein
MIDLFSVRTTVQKYHSHRYGSYRNVSFQWFKADRWFLDIKSPPSVYASAIQDYDPHYEMAPDSEHLVDELFTRVEAEMLKAYLDQNYGGCGTTEINKVNLPIPALPGNRLPYYSIPVGGETDIYMFWMEPEYALPFKVGGYFDLGACERGVKSNYRASFLVTPDGCVIDIGRAAEQLLAKYPTWTSEMALAEVERLACEGL